MRAVDRQAPIGKRGVALGYEGLGERQQLPARRADRPSNGQVIGGRTVALRSYHGYPDGTAIFEWAVAVAVVDQLGTPPVG